METQPILSICIPTYNSAEVIFQKITDILSSKSEYLQLVISDNKSTDDTLEKLSKIKDKRLKVICMEQNRGSTFNVAHAYVNADGKYAMICMDKDTIKSDRIDDVINFLAHTDVNFGYFKLNSCNTNPETAIQITESAKDCLLTFPYRALHPSGTFFKQKIIKHCFADYHLADEDIVGGFITDFMFAEASLYGMGAVIDLSLIQMEKPPFKGKKHSYTYSPSKNNVFFEPGPRYQQLIKYIKHIEGLGVDKKLKIMIKDQTIYKTFSFSTEFYARVLKQKNICDWYNVEPRKLSRKEQRQITMNFIKQILNSNFYDDNVAKIQIVKQIIRKSKFGFIRKRILIALANKGLLQ